MKSAAALHLISAFEIGMRLVPIESRQQAVIVVGAVIVGSVAIAELAKEAALSRSAFFERFQRTVALPPMEYLLAWRMAVAKDLLRRHDLSVGEVAERVGYGSASTFSTAFSRHVGRPPGRYARESSQYDRI